eukprot:8481792-Ditylum_brightwellii.AAC.1
MGDEWKWDNWTRHNIMDDIPGLVITDRPLTAVNVRYYRKALSTSNGIQYKKCPLQKGFGSLFLNPVFIHILFNYV